MRSLSISGVTSSEAIIVAQPQIEVDGNCCQLRLMLRAVFEARLLSRKEVGTGRWTGSR